MLYRTSFAFWRSVFFKFITVSVRGFLVPTTCCFKGFSLWASVGVGTLIVLELGDQIILGCTLIVAFSLFRLRYYCCNIGLFTNSYLFAIMIAFIYQCSVSFYSQILFGFD